MSFICFNLSTWKHPIQLEMIKAMSHRDLILVNKQAVWLYLEMQKFGLLVILIKT